MNFLSECIKNKRITAVKICRFTVYQRYIYIIKYWTFPPYPSCFLELLLMYYLMLILQICKLTVLYLRHLFLLVMVHIYKHVLKHLPKDIFVFRGKSFTCSNVHSLAVIYQMWTSSKSQSPEGSLVAIETSRGNLVILVPSRKSTGM